MAVKNDNRAASAAGRRFLFGFNVGLTVVLAAAILVAINWIAHRHNRRADLTGGISGYRVSDRTKMILDKAGDDLRITSVYASNSPESSRKDFLPKLQDYCEELRQYKRSVKVEHIISGDDQAELRKRVETKFGSAATEYQAVIASARELWDKLGGILKPQQAEIKALLEKEGAWLGRFSPVANIVAILNKDVESVVEVRKEVDKSVQGEGMPRYQEANDKIKSFNDTLKNHLEEIQNWSKEMDKLAKLLANPDDPFVKLTREKLGQMNAQAAELVKLIGDPKDTNVPADPKPVLQSFARAAGVLAQQMGDERTRVTAFAEQHKAIRSHERWQIQVQQGLMVMDLPDLLAITANQASTSVQQFRRLLEREGVAVDQLQGAVRNARKIANDMAANVAYWNQAMSAILDEGARIDQPSIDFLAKAAGGDLFKDALTKINELATKIAALPKLELDEVARRLQQENIVVVENKDSVRVVTFDEVYPIADPMSGMRGRDKDSPPERIFDGDSAIGSAVFSMQTAKKSVGEVVLVTFEQEVPPQMRQFQRPMTGPLPLEAIRKLRERLERMQFKVTDWNLATEGAIDKKPEAEKDVPQVFVFLPPPSAPPPFMRQQQNQPTFESKHAEVARKVLAENGRGLFLAMWMPSPPSLFGPAPKSEYGWSPILEKDWGINVDTEHRVIRGEVDRQKPGYYGIDIVQWWYMQLSDFNKDQPIGRPLRSRRMLMNDVCPVLAADKLPDGVVVTPILEVPKGTTNTWAEKDVDRIVAALQSGTSEGAFTRGEDALSPPFSVSVAAENSKTKSKLVVLGSGLAISDQYLDRRVVRFGGKGTRLMTDPPPTENLELLANALYWLVDRPELIAAGPAVVPRVEQLTDAKGVMVKVVSFGWAAVVLAVGGVVMMVRRK